MCRALDVALPTTIVSLVLRQIRTTVVAAPLLAAEVSLLFTSIFSPFYFYFYFFFCNVFVLFYTWKKERDWWLCLLFNHEIVVIIIIVSCFHYYLSIFVFPNAQHNLCFFFSFFWKKGEIIHYFDLFGNWLSFGGELWVRIWLFDRSTLPCFHGKSKQAKRNCVGKGEREKKEWNYILGVTAHSQLMNDLKHQERRKQFKKGKHINNWGYHQIFCMCAQKKRKNEYLKRNFKWILIGKNEFIEMKIWYCWIINWSWFLLLNEKV